ncbi:MAG: DUF3343 domain-containing protein [Proteobacteria bacterium]|nr:DUF3343 domain-containing protein [Pseudomonadota bacterium]
MFILIFNSVHRVMRAEKILKENYVNSKTIPVPRKLSSDCGLAIKVFDKGLNDLLNILKDEPPEEIYIEEEKNYRRVA